jgi:hypothetical protein
MEVKHDKACPGDHICSIYKYSKEQISVAIMFFTQGLNANERCVFIADENTRKELTEGLTAKGIEVKKYIESGQFIMLDGSTTYLKDGNFDIDRLVNAIADTERKALGDGFAGVRLSGELPFISGKPIDGNAVINYESAVDKYLSTSKAVAMCHYNESRYSPDILAQIVKSHHYVAIYGNCYENQFYSKKEDAPGNYTSLISAIIEG